MPDSRLLELLPSLPQRHRGALEWFHEHAGQRTPWPQPLPDGTLLATRAKGIYKPKWSEFALSVRQTLEGPYPDRPVENNADGSWSYSYYQENLDVEERDLAFANRGLLNCWRQVVPVGVMIQTDPKPAVRYRVLGLALVAGYEEGYFTLQGFGLTQVSQTSFVHASPQDLSTVQRRADLVAGAFDLALIEDNRRKELKTITLRQGQAGFRRTLLNAYDRSCAVTGYDAVDALEAAHIVAYRGPMTNHPSNGLLLRADVHNLFDFGLLSVDTDRPRFRIVLGNEIRGSSYEQLHGADLRLPTEVALQPSLEALRKHRELAGI